MEFKVFFPKLAEFDGFSPEKSELVTHGAEQDGVLGRVVRHAEHRELGTAGENGEKLDFFSGKKGKN